MKDNKKQYLSLLLLADEQESTEVCCHFCDKKYSFTSEELKELLKSAK